jgi:hypothetical protein
MAKAMWRRFPHNHRPVVVSPNYILLRRLTFGWLLWYPPTIHWRPSKLKAPSHSLFYVLRHSIHRPQKWIHVLCSHVSLSIPPHQHHYCSVGRCLPNKWRPLMDKAPPITLYFDGWHFGAPDMGTSPSERKPGHRAPIWEARAPWFAATLDVSMKM